MDTQEIVQVSEETKLDGEKKRFSIVFEDLDGGEVGISVKIEPEPEVGVTNVATTALRMGHFFFKNIEEYMKREPESRSEQVSS